MTKPTLQKNEILKHSYRPSPWSYTWKYILGMGLFTPLVEWNRRSHNYYLTSKRIIYNLTWLSKTETSIQFSKIQNVELKQSLIKRIFGYGSVYIDTSGGNDYEMIIKNVKNPQEVKRIVEAHL